MIKTGIEVFAKMVGQEVLEGLRKDSEKAKKEVNLLAAAGKGLHSSALAMNQGLELAKKAAQAVGAAFQGPVGKALEFSSGFDPAKKALHDVGRSAEYLQVAIGDTMTPVLRGAADSFKPLLDAGSKWLKQNREMIADGVTEWAARLGRILVDVVSVGLLLVVKAWYGWKSIIDIVKLAGESAWSAMLGGMSAVTEKMAALAKLTGKDGLAKSLGEFSSTAAMLSEEWSAAADKTSGALAKNNSDMDRLEKTILRVRAAVHEAIEMGVVKAFKNAREAAVRFDAELQMEAIKSLQRTQDKTEARMMLTNLAADEEIKRLTDVANIEQVVLDRRAHLYDRNFARRIELIDRLKTEEQRAAALRAAADQIDSEKRSALARREFDRAAQLEDQAVALRNKAADELYAKHEANLSIMTGAITSTLSATGGAFTTLLRQAASGTMTAGKIIEDFFGTIANAVLDTVVAIGVQFLASQILEAIGSGVKASSVVSDNAAIAASSAYAAYQFIPFIGPAIGAAAAGAAIAGTVAAAAAGKAVGFAEGGFVTGGTPGKDSVHALLMPGELVLSEPTVRRNVAAGRDPGDSGRGRGGNVTVVVDASSRALVPESPAEFDRRIIQRLLPSLRRVLASGRSL